MNCRAILAGACLLLPVAGAATPALALANRVFVSARSGNNANACDNVNTPCQTLAGAVVQLNPDGEAIVLDSGGYGAVTITQGVTIEAPAGVTAFIHPASGDAITVNAVSATVTLRGLVLNGGTSNGITVSSVGTLNVENCFITGFALDGILMASAGSLNVKGTDIKACNVGVLVTNTSGVMRASLDHCHLEGNAAAGFASITTSPGASSTTATYSTANNNAGHGWICGFFGNGRDELNLEYCTGSENGGDGLQANGANALNRARYSNCVFSDNAQFGVDNLSSGIVGTRGNNSITGNGSGPTNVTMTLLTAQ
jgi:Right handed beta helix region